MNITCPVCGAPHAACGAGPAPVHVFDVPDSARRPKMAELALYEVQHRNLTTTVKLTEEEAETYGDRAKKVGNVKKAERQDVTQPPWATTDSEKESEATPPQADSKKAPARRNKARTAESDKA